MAAGPRPPEPPAALTASRPPRRPGPAPAAMRPGHLSSPMPGRTPGCRRMWSRDRRSVRHGASRPPRARGHERGHGLMPWLHIPHPAAPGATDHPRLPYGHHAAGLRLAAIRPGRPSSPWGRRRSGPSSGMLANADELAIRRVTAVLRPWHERGLHQMPRRRGLAALGFPSPWPPSLAW